MECEPRSDIVARPGAGEIGARWFATSGGKRVRTNGPSCNAAARFETGSGAEKHKFQHRGGSGAAIHSDARRSKWRGRKLQRGAGGVLVHGRPADQSRG